MAPVRFGTIACSSIAKRRFLPALLASPHASLERVGSRTPEHGAEFGSQFQCAKTGSYQEVLEDPAVDAVYISTPAALHEEWILNAARHGKHVLCEKPALLSYAAAERCLETCRQNKVRLMEAYSFRYHPQHALVRSLQRENRIGELRFMEAQFTYPGPKPGDIRLNKELGGGTFFDSAGYPVAAALMAFGVLPRSVYTVLAMDEKTGVDHAASILLEFPTGTAIATSGFGLHYRSRYSLLGTAGRIEALRAFSVLPDKTVTITLETGNDIETFTAGPADQFELMIEDFAKAIASPSSHASEETMLTQHRVMDAAWRSHLEKRPIPLSQASS